MSFVKNKIVLLTLLIIISLPVKAAVTIELDTINFNPIVVTASRSVRQLKETPILTKVITSKDIERYGRAKIEDILSGELAGIEFHQAGYGTTLSFQGLDARHVLLLVDGERMAGEINGNIDFSRINPIGIERIEVVKGPSSVLYGSATMGATINFITKKATTKAQGGVSVSIAPLFERNSEEYGDIFNGDIAAFVSKKTGKISLMTDVKMQSSDPYRLQSSEPEMRKYIYVEEDLTTVAVPDNGEIYVPIDSAGISVSGWRMVSANQKIGADITDNLKADIKLGYYAKERFDLNSYDASREGSIYNIYKGVTSDAGLTYIFDDRHSLSYSFKGSISRQQEMASGEVDSLKQRHTLLTNRLIYTYKSDKLSLVSGVDYYYESLNYDLSEGGYNNLRSFNSLAAYIQGEYRVTEKISATAGVRGIVSEGIDGSTFVPMVAATYKERQVTYRINYSHGYRTPTLKERYIRYYQPYMGSWIVGNSALSPEENSYFSLSAEYFSPTNRFTLSVMAFANSFTNKIDTYFDDAINSYVYQNTAKSNIKGVEIMGKGVITQDLWIALNYAYNHNDEDAPTNSAQYIFTSPHTATLNGAYNLFSNDNIRCELNGTLKYIGSKRYEDRMPTILNFQEGMGFVYGIYEGYNPHYMIADAALNIDYKSKYRLSLVVDNILNYKAKVASFNAATTNGRAVKLSFSMFFR